jgi:hypothetical protein
MRSHLSVQAAPVRGRPVVHGSAVAVDLRDPRDRDQAEPSVPQVVLYCLPLLLARLCVISSPWKNITLKHTSSSQLINNSALRLDFGYIIPGK